MNREETHRLLNLAASLDNRKVTETDVLAWREVLGDIQHEDAEAAVVGFYRATTTHRITPADIRQGVRAVRSGRISRAELAAPDVDPDDVPGYVKALANQKRAIADGRDGPPALTGPDAPAPPEITMRAGRNVTVVEALKVSCPWCHAARNERCKTMGRPLTLIAAHFARTEAAREKQEASA